MLVIADSSPLIALINIGSVDILPVLFGQVVVPPGVLAELRDSRRPQVVHDFLASFPAWLVERAPSRIELIPALHAGELAAISLARELNADLLLIDEARGRKAAAERGIRYAGTVGVLELAADRELLDLPEAFDRVKKTDFWILPELLDERLKMYLARRRSR